VRITAVFLCKMRQTSNALSQESQIVRMLFVREMFYLEDDEISPCTHEDEIARNANSLHAIHNIGAGTKEEDVLFRFKVIGHYRPVFGTQSSDVTKAVVAPAGGP
jgi:hypothetical protein